MKQPELFEVWVGETKRTDSYFIQAKKPFRANLQKQVDEEHVEQVSNNDLHS